MAEIFLLRHGSKIDFETINLNVRELGFQDEDEIVFVGTKNGNVRLVDEPYMVNTISDAIGSIALNTINAESDDNISVTVYKIAQFVYDGKEVAFSYNGWEFVDYTKDENGYSDVTSPTILNGLAFIPSGLTPPSSGSSVVMEYDLNSSDSRSIYIILSYDNVVTVAIESENNSIDDICIMTAFKPMLTSTGIPQIDKEESEG